MTQRALLGLLLAGCLLVSMSVRAHHSYSEYDDAQTVEIEGKLLSVAWQNPHARIEVQVTGADSPLTWDIESAGLNNFRRMQVPLEIFKVGDTVKVAGWPSRRSAGRMYATNLLSGDGRELVLWRFSKPRWASVTYGYGSDDRLFQSGAATNAATLFQVWASDLDDPEAGAGVRTDGLPPLTAAAQKAVGEFDPIEDTTNIGCTPKGMPVVMGQPFPIELVDQGETILLRMEEYDTVRTIHMTDGVGADAQPVTLLGYSTGRWEDETLIVTTRHIGERYFNSRGIPLGTSAEIVERFTPSADGTRLNYTMTVTSPETFTAPANLRRSWVSRPGERVMPFNCTTQSGTVH